MGEPSRRALLGTAVALAVSSPMLAAASTATPLTLDTSTIPELGMTFRQAADRVRELLDLNQESVDRDKTGLAEEHIRAGYSREWNRIEAAMFSARGRTIGDVLAKLERWSCPELGVECFTLETEAIDAVAADLRGLLPSEVRHG